MPEIAVLFVEPDSVYKTIPGVDPWDQARDARAWPGGMPAVAHPPCRTFSMLRHFARAPADEHALGLYAIEVIRRWGGVVEHPAYSTLWKECDLPAPGPAQDVFGGFSMDVDQFWWGHRAQKRTWLYICGCTRAQVPQMPIVLGTSPRKCCWSKEIRVGDPRYRKQIRTKERNATPKNFALWLIELARRCKTENRNIVQSSAWPGIRPGK